MIILRKCFSDNYDEDYTKEKQKKIGKTIGTGVGAGIVGVGTGVGINSIGKKIINNSAEGKRLAGTNKAINEVGSQIAKKSGRIKELNNIHGTNRVKDFFSRLANDKVDRHTEIERLSNEVKLHNRSMKNLKSTSEKLSKSMSKKLKGLKYGSIAAAGLATLGTGLYLHNRNKE